MRRREFITLLCGVAVAWPGAARGQQPARRIGVLMNGAQNDAEVQARLTAFLDGLQQLGWTDGRNVRIDTRWASDVGANRAAEELVALGPDVILASASLSLAVLQQVGAGSRSYQDAGSFAPGSVSLTTSQRRKLQALRSAVALGLRKSTRSSGCTTIT
jgi:hypothetical protein